MNPFSTRTASLDNQTILRNDFYWIQSIKIKNSAYNLPGYNTSSCKIDSNKSSSFSASNGYWEQNQISKKIYIFLIHFLLTGCPANIFFLINTNWE